MEYYKNIKLEKVEDDKKVVYKLIHKLSDMKEEVLILEKDQLEHIISQYRHVK